MINYTLSEFSDPVNALRPGDTFSFNKVTAADVFTVCRVGVGTTPRSITLTYKNVVTDRSYTDTFWDDRKIWRRHKEVNKDFIPVLVSELSKGQRFGFYTRPNNVYEINSIGLNGGKYQASYIFLKSGRKYNMMWDTKKIVYVHPDDYAVPTQSKTTTTEKKREIKEEGKLSMNDTQLNNLITMAQADRGMFKRVTVKFDGSSGTYNFKLPTALYGVVKAGDQVVVEAADTRSDTCSVATVVAVHDDTAFDYSLNVKWKWVISKVARNAFDTMKSAEADAMERLRLKGSREALEKALGVSVADIEL